MLLHYAQLWWCKNPSNQTPHSLLFTSSQYLASCSWLSPCATKLQLFWGQTPWSGEGSWTTRRSNSELEFRVSPINFTWFQDGAAWVAACCSGSHSLLSFFLFYSPFCTFLTVLFTSFWSSFLGQYEEQTCFFRSFFTVFHRVRGAFTQPYCLQ